jgi:nucleotide-binding universal stress UspA family protein
MDYLNSVKRRTSGSDVTCETFEGNVISHIIEEAEKSPAALIAMSTHGRSGMTRWSMGSVTDNVLHHTKNSMLIVRGHGKGDPEPDIELETIIVPVDGSRLGEQVLPHVAALANALDLKVTLLRATATIEKLGAMTGYERLEGTAGLHFQSFDDMAKEISEQAVNYLEGLADSLREQGVARVERRIIRGPADEVIVDVALETPDNLVAMTTYGRSGPARWTLGSVTDRLVRHSGDPVLVISTG